MSMNEGSNFKLTSSVFYKFYPEKVDERVEAIFDRAFEELSKIEGASPMIWKSSAHEDDENHSARMNFLSEHLTEEQFEAYLKL